MTICGRGAGGRDQRDHDVPLDGGHEPGLKAQEVAQRRAGKHADGHRRGGTRRRGRRRRSRGGRSPGGLQRLPVRRFRAGWSPRSSLHSMCARDSCSTTERSNGIIEFGRVTSTRPPIACGDHAREAADRMDAVLGGVYVGGIAQASAQGLDQGRQHRRQLGASHLMRGRVEPKLGCEPSTCSLENPRVLGRLEPEICLYERSAWAGTTHSCRNVLRMSVNTPGSTGR